MQLAIDTSTLSSIRVHATRRLPKIELALTMSIHTGALLLLLSSACWAQESNDLPTPRIVGGFASAAGSYPYYATVKAGTLGTLCGASLIHEDFVMTAAHCDGVFDSGIRIGVQQMSNANDGQIRTVVEQFIHPNYKSSSFGGESSDIMLLRLSRSVTNVKPVRYAKVSASPFNGAVLTVMGFGSTSFGSRDGSPDKLNQVNVTTFLNSVCQEQYGSNFVKDIMFCAGSKLGGKDSCQGDSGR
jgi:secreted trypsin-like serine protease